MGSAVARDFVGNLNLVSVRPEINLAGTENDVSKFGCHGVLTDVVNSDVVESDGAGG